MFVSVSFDGYTLPLIPVIIALHIIYLQRWLSAQHRAGSAAWETPL